MFVHLWRRRVIYSTAAGSINLCQETTSTLYYIRKSVTFRTAELVPFVSYSSWHHWHSKWFNSVLTSQDKNGDRPTYCYMCILHVASLLELNIGLEKAKVQGRQRLTAVPWQPRWESDVRNGRSLCVSPLANTGSLGTWHAPFDSTGHPYPVSTTQTNTHIQWPPCYLYGFTGLPASHSWA